MLLGMQTCLKPFLFFSFLFFFNFMSLLSQEELLNNLLLASFGPEEEEDGITLLFPTDADREAD